MICFLPSLRGSLRPICFSSRGLSAAFTVVELLVVVVVVVGLMALLAPTVMESIKKSRDAGCVSNLKAIGVAVQLYLNDNNGKFPIDGYHTANDRNFVFPYLGLPKSILDVWKKEGSNVFCCPSVQAVRDRSIDAPGYASNHVLFADASENVNTGELNTPETWPLAAANVNAPAKMWIFTEGTRADPPGAPLRGNRIFSHNSLRGDLPYWPHEGKRKNFLFLDGHIEALDARQVGERNKEKTTAWKEFHGMVRGL